MKQIKIFQGYEYEIESEVNEFLGNKDVNLIDIKYQSNLNDEGLIQFAMVIYGVEELEE